MQVPRTDNFHSPSVHVIEYLSMNEDTGSYEKHLKGVAGDLRSLCVRQTAA